MKACRLCLAIQVRLFNLGNNDAKQFIENVFINNGFKHELCEKHYICYECKALLHKSYSFIKRLLTAQDILQNLMKKETKLTTSILNAIDREQAGISSSLTTHFLKNIDYFDSVYIKGDIFDFDIETNSSKDDILDISDIYGTKDDLVQEESKNKDITIKTSTENIDKNDAALTIKKKKTRLRKKKTKGKNRKRNNVKTEIGAVKPVKKKYKTILEPSKFMLSLPSVGDRSERRKNKTYAFKEKIDKNSKEDVSDYQPDSSDDECSYCSEDDYYNEKGRRRLNPVREYPRTCNLCEFEVMGGKEHYLHYLNVHPDSPYPFAMTDKPTFVCQFCGKIHRTKNAHVDHELTHGNEKKFTCLKCPKKFYNRKRLLTHLNITHRTAFKECDYCGKKFKVKCDIIKHIRIHTGEKPFKCIVCGFGFTTRGNLGIHVRSKHESLDKKERKKKDCKRKRESVSSSESDSLITLSQLKNKSKNNK